MQVLKQEIRQKILRAAENSFFEVGFTGASTRSIAGEAGISVSNLYKYFKNKHEIFSAVIEPFYKFTKDDLSSLFEEDHNENDADIMEKTIKKIMRMLKNDRYKFVILVNRSEGTGYEHVKKEMIDIAANHMIKTTNHESVKDDYVLMVIAANFLEGILCIAEKYHDNESTIRDNINTLVHYHMAGIAQFL